MKRMTACMLAIVLGFGAQAAEGPSWKHWDLGVGKYSAAWDWCGGDVLDLARYDWALVQLGNEPPTLATVGRINQAMALNPKLKIMIRLWPKPGFVRQTLNPKKERSYIGFLDYLYYPEAKAAFLKDALAQLHVFTDNLLYPQNVYGCTIFEELPHQFGYNVNILSKTKPDPKWTDLEHFKLFYGQQYKAETGKELTEWNRDLRIWWGRKFAKALRDIAHEIKKDSPKVRVFAWFISGVRLLDWLEEGEDVHSPMVIPCHWKDIVGPDGADGFFAYNNNATWAERYQKLATENHWPYFSQLSHAGQMRLDSWEKCLEIAKADVPENLGYFYYGPDFTYGHWNDDPDVRPEDVPALSGLYPRMRRFLAKENVGMDIVLRQLTPSVVFSHELGNIALRGFGMATAVVTNRRTEEWCGSEAAATLKDVTLRLDLPEGFSVPPTVSCPATVTIPRLAPGDTKEVTWWVRRDKETAKDAKLPASVTLTSPGVETVVVRGDAQVLEPHPTGVYRLRNGIERLTWADYSIGWHAQPVQFELACSQTVMNPSFSVNGRKILWRGDVRAKEKLVVNASAMTAELVNRKGIATNVTDRLSGLPSKLCKGVHKIVYADDTGTLDHKGTLTVRLTDPESTWHD